MEYEDERQCRVESGRWWAPHLGHHLENPRHIDVDHYVPLKNAHLSGRWAWDAGKKEDYANYLDDPEHLGGHQFPAQSPSDRQTLNGADAAPSPKEGQETACPVYCSDRQSTVAAVYADTTGSTDKYEQILGQPPGKDGTIRGETVHSRG